MWREREGDIKNDPCFFVFFILRCAHKAGRENRSRFFLFPLLSESFHNTNVN